MAFIGLDVGTTGTKCIIADKEGKILAQDYKEYPTESPEVGYFELNPELVWKSVKTVLRSSIEQFGYDIRTLAGISVSSLGEAAVLLDCDGETLGNSLLYIDSRGEEQLKRLEEKLGEDTIIEKTGLKPHSMYTLPKLMWYKEEMPKIYQEIKTVLSFGSFILYRLGCRPIMDYSLASRTMAFNVHELQWDDEIIHAAGIRRNILPEIAPTGTLVGTVDCEIAKELGLPADLKLVLGAHDQVCAAIGAGINEENTAVYGLGTVSCICPVFSNDVNGSKISRNNFPHVPYLKGMYTTYAFNFTGGSLLKWFRDEFASLEMQESKSTGRSVYDILNEKTGDQPTDILVLPHFAGTGTPYMNPLSSGAVLGLNFNTTKADLYRALMEGITYEMKYNLDCLEEAAIFIDDIRACGGGAKSDLWLQITADILNKRITALDINEAGILGTIILTSVALGTYSSYQAASKNFIKINKVFYPQEKNLKKYRENYRKYKKMYRAIQDVMETSI
jgi:xylulokinase